MATEFTELSTSPDASGARFLGAAAPGGGKRCRFWEPERGGGVFFGFLVGVSLCFLGESYVSLCFYLGKLWKTYALLKGFPLSGVPCVSLSALHGVSLSPCFFGRRSLTWVPQ